MQHRRKPASAAAPAAAKQAPSRRPTAPLSLAALVISIFLVATFLYNDQVLLLPKPKPKPNPNPNPKVGASDSEVSSAAASVARARSPDLRVLQEQEVEEDHRTKENNAQEEHQGKQGQVVAVPAAPPGCNLYQGKWTFDAAGERSPLYRESECEFLTEQVTCIRNGRRDDSYQKWRWQPAGCDLPRYDAKVLLERLRNKRLMFVGDSLNRNQWESMVCLVQSAVPRGQKTLHKFVNNGSLNIFKAHEYNATVEFYWAPFLVQSNSDDPQVHSVLDRVIAWRAIAKHATNWKGVDYLVFNTYIWWLNNFEMKVVKGAVSRSRRRSVASSAHHQTIDDNDKEQAMRWSKYALVDRPVAYREVLKTWAKWVDRHIDPNKTTVFFMGMSPNHITPWAWGNDGGIKCAMETQPIVNRSSPLNIGTDWRLHGVARGVLARYLHRVPVHFVDITALSELRKDAHTSVHTLRQGKLLTPEQQADPKAYADCIHWCLPGLPDTWNHFLYAHIISLPASSSSSQSPQDHH